MTQALGGVYHDPRTVSKIGLVKSGKQPTQPSIDDVDNVPATSRLKMSFEESSYTMTQTTSTLALEVLKNLSQSRTLKLMSRYA